VADVSKSAADAVVSADAVTCSATLFTVSDEDVVRAERRRHVKKLPAAALASSSDSPSWENSLSGCSSGW
jgi:hypothetical protein